MPLLTNSGGQTFEDVRVSPEDDKECITGYATPDTALEIRTDGLLVNGEPCYCTEDIFAKVVSNKKTMAKMCLGRLRAQAKFVPKAVERLVTLQPNLLDIVGSSTDMDVDPAAVPVTPVGLTPPPVPTTTAHAQAVEGTAAATATASPLVNESRPVAKDSAMDTSEVAASDGIGDDIMDINTGSSDNQRKKVGDALKTLMGVNKPLPLSCDTKKGLTIPMIQKIMKQLMGKECASRGERKSALYTRLCNKLKDALEKLSDHDRGRLAEGLDMDRQRHDRGHVPQAVSGKPGLW